MDLSGPPPLSSRPGWLRRRIVPKHKKKKYGRKRAPKPGESDSEGSLQAHSVPRAVSSESNSHNRLSCQVGVDLKDKSGPSRR